MSRLGVWGMFPHLFSWASQSKETKSPRGQSCGVGIRIGSCGLSAATRTTVRTAGSVARTRTTVGRTRTRTSRLELLQTNSGNALGSYKGVSTASWECTRLSRASAACSVSIACDKPKQLQACAGNVSDPPLVQVNPFVEVESSIPKEASLLGKQRTDCDL